MSVDVFLGGTPRRRRSAALFEQLREAISQGRLAPGDRLPTSRDLARDAGVARSTITTVYGRLIAEGYARGRVGDGTFVARHPSARPVDAPTATPTIDIRRPSSPAPSPLMTPDGGWLADLRTGRPDPALFPVVEWRRCVVTASQTPPPGYGHPAGHPQLRRAIAAWVSRSRDVRASPEEVLVTAGAQGAFDLCAGALVGRSDTVAVEDPGYQPAWRAFERHGANLTTVPVDADGMVVAHLPGRVRAIYVTPSHQSPTGAILSAARRRELLDFVTTHDAVVIEDDYDTEYRYVDRPLEPLHRLDGSGRVVYVGSFSKTLSPSLRLGFVVAPAPIVAALTATRAHVDTQPPSLTQVALAEFLTTGGFERHLRRTHRAYRARRDVLTGGLDMLRANTLIADYTPCTAGLHTIVRLHPTADADAIAEILIANGIAIESMTACFHGPAEPGLLIGYGLAGVAELERAIDQLGNVLSKRRDGPRRSRSAAVQPAR